MNRAKKMVRWLVNANINCWGDELPKFLTLTFKEDVRDIKKANYEFKKFRQRLEYSLGVKLKYLGVIEFTKKGRIHYHVIFFNMPYIKHSELLRIWGNGGLRINAIDNIDNVGAYVCKYMTKIDDLKFKNLIGKKCYFTSRGLKKQIEIVDKKKIEQIKKDAALSQKLVYESTYINDYQGKINYKQYNVKREKLE